jgi:hypothetical protein
MPIRVQNGLRQAINENDKTSPAKYMSTVTGFNENGWGYLSLVM